MEQNVGASTSNKTSLGVGGELIKKQELTELIGVGEELIEKKEGTEPAGGAVFGNSGTKSSNQFF